MHHASIGGVSRDRQPFTGLSGNYSRSEMELPFLP